MASPRNHAYDTQKFRELWYSQTPLNDIAKAYNRSAPAIVQAAQRRGMASPRSWLHRFPEMAKDHPSWVDAVLELARDISKRYDVPASHVLTAALCCRNLTHEERVNG